MGRAWRGPVGVSPANRQQVLANNRMNLTGLAANIVSVG